MINRARMLLDDIDSEGFPIPHPREPAPLLALNIGRAADHGMVQALLADHKCVVCAPRELTAEEKAFLAAHEALHQAMANRPREACTDPRCVLFGTEKTAIGNGCHCDKNPNGWVEVDGVPLPPITWAQEAREMVDMADRAMDIGAKGDLLRSMQDCANLNHDGITRLSDSYAPDAYYGWKK